ncbi:MAG: hypothetical protein HY757_03995 [Nitrospirae bacterium]|nr:hypothetical protein [Nitrospirota bacterium]
MTILKINFIQMGGILFLLIPFGIYHKRDRSEFKIVFAFILIFMMIASTSVWATDARLMPMTYFWAVLGSAGMYYLAGRAWNITLKRMTGLLLIISLLLYAGIIEYYYMAVDTRKESSDWIEKNVLTKNDNITIGLNGYPYFASPHIITKEWMHNEHPESSYYPDRYNETFVIPDYRLIEYGGKRILPEKELLSTEEKIKWLESKSPEFVTRYELIKHFRSYDILGTSYLDIYSFDIYIYKKISGKSNI